MPVTNPETSERNFTPSSTDWGSLLLARAGTDDAENSEHGQVQGDGVLLGMAAAGEVAVGIDVAVVVGVRVDVAVTAAVGV
jgi:hypothetical protein